MQRKTQLVTRRGELVAEAAQHQEDATRGGEPLAVSALPAAAMSTERAALSLATVYDRWANDAAELDVLLSRTVQLLADELRAVADQARKVRADARDALVAGED